MPGRRARNQFPRSRDLPAQSSQYWAKEKDRYIRQLLICDIEEDTGRELVVCFSRLDQSITETDSNDLYEVLQGIEGTSIDVMLHTPGGLVDAVEKFITVLQCLKPDYRVIIPSWAKSGGTLIALASKKILLGVNSELGPVDPQINLPDYGVVPAECNCSPRLEVALIRSVGCECCS
jgi:ClpP class serine protease